MKKFIHLLLATTFLFFGIGKLLSQNTCSGTIQSSALATFSASTTIGNGTPGCLSVCLTTNAIGTNRCTGNNEGIIVRNTAGTIIAYWTSATPVGTCVTVTGGSSGFANLSYICNRSGVSTVTWTTVNCSSGLPSCPTCTDGIQNQGETGVDCGGPCPACTGSCFDGIQNGLETGVDCGGTCPACPTCFDGIRNQGETGVDCGGPCALSCTTNSTPVSSACGVCPVAAQATVFPTNCDQVGTTAYNLNSPIGVFSNCTGSTAPTPAPTCAATNTSGTWVRLDLAPGVTQVQLAFNSGSLANGNSNTWAAAYQGADCGSLSPVTGGCQNAVFFQSGSQFVNQVFFRGLNPNEDLWIYMFNDANNEFNLNFNLVGTIGAPSNTTCGAASTAIGAACNLGSAGASFPTPGSAGVACSGGNWGSNENTTFYAFTATQTTASLTISGIACNNGESGQAQFAVWTSCASVGTYTAGSGFLGCAVGSGTINLTGLTAGQTYFIAADGFAGDNCRWTFTGNNIIILPVEINNFNAENIKNYVKLDWSTETETDNESFIIERSKDGVNFETIASKPGAGNSSNISSYDYNDYKPHQGVSYYRLKQLDYSGYYKYSKIVAVNVKPVYDNVVIYPNPVSENGIIEFVSDSDVEQIISIFNAAGILITETKYQLSEGLNQLNLESANLSTGMYFVRFGDFNIKFIKE
jgi:hypothetical protein